MTSASALTGPLQATALRTDSTVVAVVARGAFASHRIATALEGSGIGSIVLADTVEDLLVGAAKRPDAIVLACDPSVPASLTAVRRLRAVLHHGRIVIVSQASGGAGVRQALGAGASGVVLETEIEATLAPTTQAVLVGNISVPRALQRCVYRPAFSYRERQVLAMVVRGLGNRQIAGSLFLAESTVKSHLASAFQKLGVGSRKEAAALLTDPSEDLGSLVLGVEPDAPLSQATSGTGPR